MCRCQKLARIKMDCQVDFKEYVDVHTKESKICINFEKDVILVMLQTSPPRESNP